MAVTKFTRTYVLYTDGDNKFSVAEENNFESVSEAKDVQEIARQTFLIPQISESADSDDLAELIPDTELRVNFLNKVVNQKLTLYINQLMKKAENVEVSDSSGKTTTELRSSFVEQSEPIDLTEQVGAAPKRERLTQDVKIKRILGGMSKEDQTKFLQEMLAAMQANGESDDES